MGEEPNIHARDFFPGRPVWFRTFFHTSELLYVGMSQKMVEVLT